MKTLTFVLCLCLLLPSIVFPVDEKSTRSIRPVNTYSIVCYDSVTGQFGAVLEIHLRITPALVYEGA